MHLFMIFIILEIARINSIKKRLFCGQFLKMLNIIEIKNIIKYTNIIKYKKC